MARAGAALVLSVALVGACAGEAIGLQPDSGVASKMMRRETDEGSLVQDSDVVSLMGNTTAQLASNRTVQQAQQQTVAAVEQKPLAAGGAGASHGANRSAAAPSEAAQSVRSAAGEPAWAPGSPDALVSDAVSVQKAAAAAADLESEGIVSLWKAARSPSASQELLSTASGEGGQKVEVEQHGSSRRLRFQYHAADGQLRESVSSMDCGGLASDKPNTCESQQCSPAEDASNLVQDDEGQEMVSVGPAVLGDRLKRVALIGVAGGMQIHFLHRLNPELSIDAVESSPTIATALLSCFGVPANDHVHLHMEDGAGFLLSQANQSYNWIIINAPGAQAKFATPEMHRNLKRLVGPEGIVTFSLAGLDLKSLDTQQALATAHEYWEHAFTTQGGRAITLAGKDLNAQRRDGEAQLTALSPGKKTVQAVFARWFGDGLQPLSMGPATVKD